MEREEQKERERRGWGREGARPKSTDPRPTMLLRVEYPVRVQCTEPAQLAYLMPLPVSLSLPLYLSLELPFSVALPLPLLHSLSPSLSCPLSFPLSPSRTVSSLFSEFSQSYVKICMWLTFFLIRQTLTHTHTHTYILSYIFDVYMVDTDIGICIYRACAINTCLGKFADQVQLFLSFFLALLSASIILPRSTFCSFSFPYYLCFFPLPLR